MSQIARKSLMIVKLAGKRAMATASAPGSLKAAINPVKEDFVHMSKDADFVAVYPLLGVMTAASGLAGYFIYRNLRFSPEVMIDKFGRADHETEFGFIPDNATGAQAQKKVHNTFDGAWAMKHMWPWSMMNYDTYYDKKEEN